MTAKRIKFEADRKAYLHWLNKRDLTAYGAAFVLGISLRSSHRIAAGEQAIPPTLARLMYMLDRHGIPRDWS